MGSTDGQDVRKHVEDGQIGLCFTYWDIKGGEYGLGKIYGDIENGNRFYVLGHLRWAV